MKHKKVKLADVRLRHEVLLKERFFLKSGSNMMSYATWRRKPNILRDQYLKQHDLDRDTSCYDDLLSPQDIVEASSGISDKDAGPSPSPLLMREDGIELTETKVEASHKQQPARRHKEEKASVNKPKASLSSTSGAASSPFFTTRIQIPLSTVSTSLQTPPVSKGTVTVSPSPLLSLSSSSSSSPTKALLLSSSRR